jgi:hypothetical protein
MHKLAVALRVGSSEIPTALYFFGKVAIWNASDAVGLAAL